MGRRGAAEGTYPSTVVPKRVSMRISDMSVFLLAHPMMPHVAYLPASNVSHYKVQTAGQKCHIVLFLHKRFKCIAAYFKRTEAIH